MRDYLDVLGLLKRELFRQELDQQTVAKWLKVTPATVSLLFAGLRPMKAEQMMIIMDKLAMQPDYLFDFKGGKEPYAGISAKNQKTYRKLFAGFQELDDASIDFKTFTPAVENIFELAQRQATPPKRRRKKRAAA